MTAIQLGAYDRRSVESNFLLAAAATTNALATPSGGQGGTVSPVDPAVTVTLSVEAQQRLEADKAAADKLAQLVVAGSAREGADAAQQPSDYSWDDLFDIDVIEPDPTKVLQPVSREQQIASVKEAKTALIMGRVERTNPEGAAALRDAIANGTVKIRSADSVAGVNYKTTSTVSGGAYSASHSTRFDPAPEVKAQIDNGRALAMWDAKLGDIFLTW